MNNRKMRWVVLCIIQMLMLFPTWMHAQTSRTDLEKRRQSIMEQIRIAQDQLKDIKKDKSASMSELKALQAKLNARQALIANINQEINSLNNNIASSAGEVASLSNRLETLKMRYAQSVRYAYAHRNSYSVLAFIFSSASYNEAIRRMKYVRKLSNFRKDQVEDIRVTQNVIEKKITDLNVQKSKKSVLLTAEEVQRNEIQKETNETNEVVKSLKGKESELITSIDRNKKSARKLDAAISSAIKREIEIARKKALEEERKRQAEIARQKQLEQQRQQAEIAKQREAEELRKRNEALAVSKPTSTTPVSKPTTTNTNTASRPPGNYRPTYGSGSNTVRLNTGSNSGGSRAEPEVAMAPAPKESVVNAAAEAKTANMSYKMMLTPEATNLSNNFESNRGRLPWPVERGIISSSFGTHKHAVAQRVNVENDGIDIQATAGSLVRSVFDGTVTSVFAIAGRGNVVLISHGLYFTVYSQLAGVNVAKGQAVRTKQAIGTVGTNEDGMSMINFQVWKVGSGNNTSKMNPEGWIAR